MRDGLQSIAEIMPTETKLAWLDAEYAAGVREILECWFDDRPIPDEYLIVDGGKLAGTGAHSYSAKG